MLHRYEDELEYWRGFLGSLQEGTASPRDLEKYQAFTNPDFELNSELAAELPLTKNEAELKVLDVGCGPISLLGNRCAERRLAITGVDPLADQYKAMLKGLGVTPSFELRRGFGEDLDRDFPHDHFDFVYSCNALDHSQTPHAAIRAMIRVAKPGAAIWVNVNRNEGINASYNGLHSWNFETLVDTIVLWNPAESHLFEEITEGLPFRWQVKDVETEKTFPQQIDIVIYKDAVDLSKMTRCEPGIYSALTGRGRFLTLWAPSDLDERYNFFVHGLSKDGSIVFNKSLRWYNKLRRRSTAIPTDRGIALLRFGQFDVDFEAGRPIYDNRWTGSLRIS